MVEDLPALERFWDINVERAVIRNSITARHRLAPVILLLRGRGFTKTLMGQFFAACGNHFFPRFQKVICPPESFAGASR